MFAIIVSEKGGAERKESFDKNEINVGRVQGNDLMLPKGNVSKHHARLLYRDGRFIVTDLKSTNGTYVNGRKIAQATIVREGDKIYIGDFILRVDMGGVGAAPSSNNSVDEQQQLGSTGATSVPASPPVPMPPGMPPLPGGMPPLPQPQPPVPPGMAALPNPPTPGIAMPMPPGSRAPGVTAGSSGAVSHFPLERDPDESDGAIQTADRPAPQLPSAPRLPTVPPAAPPPPAPVQRSTLALNTNPAAVRASAPPPPLPPPPPVSPPSVPPPAPVKHGTSTGSRVPPRESPAHAGRRLALVTLVDRVADATDLSGLGTGSVDAGLQVTIERVVAEQAKAMREEEGIPYGIELEQLRGDALRELVGIGALGPLIDDEDISEIHCLRHDQILVVRAGTLSMAEGAFTSEQALSRAISRLAIQAGQPLREGEWHVIRHLSRGANMIAFCPPAVTTPAIVIRKRRRVEMSLEDFTRIGAMSRPMATFVDGCLGARANILVCGSSISAANSFLGALAAHGAPGERIVIVQEDDEFNIPHAQVLRLHLAHGGEELLRTAAKTRPDRWIAGTLSGRGVAATLEAVTEGAEGVLATAAAPTLRHALSRLVTQLLLGQAGMSSDAARECVSESFDIGIEVNLLPDGRYRIARIAELAGVDAKGFVTRDIFVAEGSADGHVATGVVPRIINEFAARGIRVDTNLFKKVR